MASIEDALTLSAVGPKAALALLDLWHTRHDDGWARLALTLCNGEDERTAPFQLQASRRRLEARTAQQCRATDYVFSDDRGVWLLMPGATAVGATAAVHRLQELTPLGECEVLAGIVELSEEIRSPRDAVAAAERALAQATEPAEVEEPTLSIHVFRCPETGAMVECAMRGWRVEDCSGSHWSPKARCSERCVASLREGIALASTWTAQEAEPIAT